MLQIAIDRPRQLLVIPALVFFFFVARFVRGPHKGRTDYLPYCLPYYLPLSHVGEIDHRFSLDLDGSGQIYPLSV